MRLDRFLVQSDICTRSEAKKLIKQGRVCVNGSAASDPAARVDEAADTVSVDGKAAVYEKFRYYMLNKPAGYVSATEDASDAIVLDLLAGAQGHDLFPVGRLDKDTEGLLIITNDGQLAHRLTSPRHHVDKRYLAVTDGKLSGRDMETFASGMDIGDDRPTLPALIEERPDGYIVTIREGRFHQIKRMFYALGVNVTYLKRLSMGPIELDDTLAPGDFRPLSAEEIALLKAADGQK